MRWKLEGADGQGALFDTVERVPGRGEFRGMEFLHVRAGRLINTLPPGPLPFRHTVNVYRGCSHACSYCFARPTHDYLDLDIDEGFDRTIVVKTNAVERLRAELNPKRWAGEPIAMGTNTDPYQRCEGKYHLTQGAVDVLSLARNPFSILTKSTLVLRDADRLAEAATRTQVSLTFSIGTLDDDVWRATETGAPPPWKRIEAIARLRDKGVEAGVLMAPILPGLSDGADQIEAVVKAATDAGAVSVGGGMPLFLKPGVREVFLRRLRESHPHLVDRYERAYADGRVHPSKAVKDDVRRKLDAALQKHRPASRVRIRRWRPVEQPAAPPPVDPGEQLRLGV